MNRILRKRFPRQIRADFFRLGSLFLMIALCMYIVIAICAGFFMFLKMRYFRIIGSFLECQMRKLVINKYLNMHMGFYDREENSPGALLSKLSIGPANSRVE